MLWLIPVAVVVLIVIAVACAVLAKKSKPKADGDVKVKTIVQQTLSMHDVVSFFRKPEIMRKLQESKDKIAVVTRENGKDGSFIIVLCIYNKTTNDIADPEDLLRYEVSELAEDLKTVFGDKSMIVLK